MIKVLIDAVKSAGLISLPFTLYFAWTRLGHRVAASYSWRIDRLVASGIGNVTLMNMKDRPVAIFEIHAAMDGNSFALKEFDPPLILKAMECVSIETDLVSHWRLGQDIYDWKPPKGKPSDVDIYLSTSSKTIKCQRKSPASRIAFIQKKRLHLVVSETQRFNDIVYNHNAKFAVTYTENNQDKTALIDNSGLIRWNYPVNCLRPEHMRSPETVKNFFVACGLAKIISPFVVEDLPHPPGQQKLRVSRSSLPS